MSSNLLQLNVDNVYSVVYKNFKQFCTQHSLYWRGFKSCVDNVYIVFIILVIKYYNNNHNNIVGIITGKFYGVSHKWLCTLYTIATPLDANGFVVYKRGQNLMHNTIHNVVHKTGASKYPFCVQCEQLKKQLCTMYTNQKHDTKHDIL
jgi:hypothetical protein